MVEGTFGLTVSIAESTATRTSATPMACARSIAFCTMSTLSSSVGAMLIAASVMIRASSWPGTSITKQWLTRRAVRNPISRLTTAAISSSVCRLPFISASALPSRTSRTAVVAAASLCGASTISTPAKSISAAAATARMRSRGPTRIGTISPSRRRLHRTLQRRGVARVRYGRRRRRHRLAPVDQALVLLVFCGGHVSLFGRHRKNAGTMSTNRIFTIVMPGKIIA